MNHLPNFHSFAEKRLLFVRGHDSPEKKDHPDKSASTPHQSAAQTAEELRKLSDEIASEDFSGRRRKKPRRRGPNTHTGPQLTRSLSDRRRPTYVPPENLGQQLELEGQLDSNETKAMQNAQAKIFAQYLSPAFITYLNQPPTTLQQRQSVYRNMDLLVEHPDAFSYETQSNNTLLIRKRQPPTAQGSPAIPDDFEVVMEEPGNIVKIAGIDLKSNGKVPWMNADAFNRNASLYFSRFNSELSNHVKSLIGNKQHLSAAEIDKIKKQAFDNISLPMKDIRVTMNIRFPHHLADLIRGRKFPFESQDRQIQEFLTSQGKQGTTYESLIDHWYVGVGRDPKYPEGTYQVYTENYLENPLVINYAGYIMRPQPDGSWKPDARYGEAIRRKYYLANNGRTHQKAWDHGGLSAHEKRTMQDLEPRGARGREANNVADTIYRYMQQREPFDRTIKKYCKRPPNMKNPQQVQQFVAQRSRLKEVAKAVSREPLGPNPRTHAATQARNDRWAAAIDRIQDPRILKKMIEEYLDREYMQIRVNSQWPKLDAAQAAL